LSGDIEGALSLPAQDDCAPCQAAANGFCNKQVTAFDLATLNTHRQGEGDGRSRGVAVVLYGHNNLIHAHAELFGSALDNADVGLMWHNPINIFVFQAGFLKGGIRS
jgi:hypothetical protein